MRSKINHEKIIFIIAGELSGDHIGAGLIHQLKKLCNKPIKFIGVGGPQKLGCARAGEIFYGLQSGVYFRRVYKPELLKCLNDLAFLESL